VIEESHEKITQDESNPATLSEPISPYVHFPRSSRPTTRTVHKQSIPLSEKFRPDFILLLRTLPGVLFLP